MKCNECRHKETRGANEYCTYHDAYIGWHGCEYGEPKPQTNADKIRSMSDYDLADWIARILGYHGLLSRRRLTVDDNECPHECPLYKCCNDQPSDNIEDWLKAPVEDREVDK